ncbi:immunity 22 family protein [Compostimonas suwonensis]|uniref:Immunity protein 22 of polymorphic toxin system n=1 Tax=Compostimonas suwonensis TaxID=1048394 RepID=A0A2M9C4F0_9MICO|nr:immunity 22 family protein [Compostimonas suwonensis]PJJ65405.1 immunity protein 22 of polymorphic toxin system [Compostimonas suwonensis]
MKHTEEFIRALVDEALNRTPPGGFPELEKRHGLRAGTLFDWVERYGPSLPPRPFSALHFWLGTSTLDEAAFGAYFDHDPAYWSLEVEEIESAPADVTGCGFSVDLGERFLYDDDLLQVMWRSEPVPVRELVDETTLSSDAAARLIVRECAARGILTANAGFVYADPAQEIRDPGRLYNGLQYIGLFENS